MTSLRYSRASTSSTQSTGCDVLSGYSRPSDWPLAVAALTAASMLASNSPISIQHELESFSVKPSTSTFETRASSAVFASDNYAVAAPPRRSGWIVNSHNTQIKERRRVADWHEIRPLPWHDIHSDLSRWMGLPTNWDGEGGQPVSEAAVDTARVLLEQLLQLNISRPEHYIDSDSEISFDWKKNGRNASLIIHLDGTISGYAENVDRTALAQVNQVAASDKSLISLLDILQGFA